jgi:hypothetical protein
MICCVYILFLLFFCMIGCLWVTKINFLCSHLLLPSGRHAHLLSSDFFLNMKLVSLFFTLKDYTL